MHQIAFGGRLCPYPLGELTALPRPPSCIGEGKGSGVGGGKRMGEERQGREEKGKM